MKHEMFGNFDPYDTIMLLQSRLSLLENAHNGLATAYNKQHDDLQLALEAIQTLQRAYLNLSQQVNSLSVIYDPTPHKSP
jgi:hypothetical protein